APRATVWSTLADLGGVADYNPNLARSSWLSAAREGIGAARQCVLPDHSTIDERVVAWDDGRGYTLAVTDGAPTIVRRMEVRFELEEIGPQSTRVTQTMDVALALAPLTAPLGWLMRPALRSAITANLQGLAEAVEGHALAAVG
ncbi:MAG: SRPBCC family protein, partial [Myxococcota bacterium]